MGRSGLTPEDWAAVQHRFHSTSFSEVTPGELMQERLDRGDVRGALALAHTYDLDTDALYRRLWSEAPCDELSITRYLANVKDSRWVCLQACRRVAAGERAAWDLLDHVEESILEGCHPWREEVHVDDHVLVGIGA